ncbi:MAG: hypothetical protein AAF449_02965, partial [Myxococcota bacterium]
MSAAMTVLSFGWTGCFVDLQRDEALLQILIEGVSVDAEDIVVQVDDRSDLGAFTERFQLAEAALPSSAGSQILPVISLAPGTVSVTGHTVDGQGTMIDGPVNDEIVLVQGTSGLTIDFSAPPTMLGLNDRLFILPVRTTLMESPTTGAWSISMPLDAVEWASALAQVSDELGGTPTRISIRHATLVSEPELDESAE